MRSAPGARCSSTASSRAACSSPSATRSARAVPPSTRPRSRRSRALPVRAPPDAMELLGRGALILALLAAVFATAAGWGGGVPGDRGAARAGARALVAAFAAALAAAIVLWIAIVRHDFRFEQVVDHSSRDLPAPYLVSSLWSSQAGSLLLWVL